jgi:hypothetical protein
MKISEDFQWMQIHFEENEFTTTELLKYLKAAYGKQMNGSHFQLYHIHSWIRYGKVPEIYGGYKITDARKYKELGEMVVITLEGFTRDEMLANIDALKTIKVPAVNKRKPHKQRTKLYYQILTKAGKQYTEKTLEQATLPTFWKEAGGKANQVVRGRKKQSSNGHKNI